MQFCKISARPIVGALCTLAMLAGCSDNHSHAATPVPGADDLTDVIYENETTDEALIELQSRALLTGKTPKLMAPTENQTFNVPTALVWTEPTATLQFWPAVRSLFEGTALAHGTPINGGGYFVVISSKSNPKVARIFTSKTSYTPSADVWTKLKTETGMLTVTVKAATFDDNKIPSAGGPYVSAPVTFSVKP
jgi:hypothetical protein